MCLTLLLLHLTQPISDLRTIFQILNNSEFRSSIYTLHIIIYLLSKQEKRNDFIETNFSEGLYAILKFLCSVELFRKNSNLFNCRIILVEFVQLKYWILGIIFKEGAQKNRKHFKLAIVNLDCNCKNAKKNSKKYSEKFIRKILPI